jgi:hypothetical protein
MSTRAPFLPASRAPRESDRSSARPHIAYANAGIPVLLKEVEQPALDRGLATIRKNYAGSVHKGRLSQQQMDQRLALMQPTLVQERAQCSATGAPPSPSRQLPGMVEKHFLRSPPFISLGPHPTV